MPAEIDVPDYNLTPPPDPYDDEPEPGEPPELSGFGAHLLDTAALLLRAHRRMYP